jgi:hypothetical protein
MQLGKSFSLLGIKDYPYAGCVLTWGGVSRDSDCYLAGISCNQSFVTYSLELRIIERAVCDLRTTAQW